MKNILLLTTGGTIACTNTKNGLKPAKTGYELISMLPKIPDDTKINIKEIRNIDSTDMTPDIWYMLVNAVEENYERYDGFVITHGTDTLSYTSSALYCLIQNSSKPVILTGSQLPISNPLSDAVTNLTDAIICASCGKISGVQVVFAGKVISGSSAKKIHTSAPDAFVSVNKKYTAEITQDGEIITNNTDESLKNKPVKFYKKLDENVAPVILTPCTSTEQITSLLADNTCLLIQSYGVGGIPDRLFEPLKKLFKSHDYRNKFLLINTQVLYGGTNIRTYETGRRLYETIPFIEAGALTFEMSLIKMMWVLANSNDNFEDIKKLFETHI